MENNEIKHGGGEIGTLGTQAAAVTAQYEPYAHGELSQNQEVERTIVRLPRKGSVLFAYRTVCLMVVVAGMLWGTALSPVSSLNVIDLVPMTAVLYALMGTSFESEAFDMRGQIMLNVFSVFQVVGSLSVDMEVFDVDWGHGALIFFIVIAFIAPIGSGVEKVPLPVGDVALYTAAILVALIVGLGWSVGYILLVSVGTAWGHGIQAWGLATAGFMTIFLTKKVNQTGVAFISIGARSLLMPGLPMWWVWGLLNMIGLVMVVLICDDPKGHLKGIVKHIQAVERHVRGIGLVAVFMLGLLVSRGTAAFMVATDINGNEEIARYSHIIENFCKDHLVCVASPTEAWLETFCTMALSAIPAGLPEGNLVYLSDNYVLIIILAVAFFVVVIDLLLMGKGRVSIQKSASCLLFIILGVLPLYHPYSAEVWRAKAEGKVDLKYTKETWAFCMICFFMAAVSIYDMVFEWTEDKLIRKGVTLVNPQTMRIHPKKGLYVFVIALLMINTVCVLGTNFKERTVVFESREIRVPVGLENRTSFEERYLIEDLTSSFGICGYQGNDIEIAWGQVERFSDVEIGVRKTSISKMLEIDIVVSCFLLTILLLIGIIALWIPAVEEIVVSILITLAIVFTVGVSVTAQGLGMLSVDSVIDWYWMTQAGLLLFALAAGLFVRFSNDGLIVPWSSAIELLREFNNQSKYKSVEEMVAGETRVLLPRGVTGTEAFRLLTEVYIPEAREAQFSNVFGRMQYPEVRGVQEASIPNGTEMTRMGGREGIG